MPSPHRLGRRAVLYLLVALAMVWTLFPIYWMVTTSLKLPIEYASPEPSWAPTRITFEHYRSLWEHRFLRYFLNTVITAAAATVVSLLCGFLAAYALARFRFPAKLDNLFLLWVLLVKMIPPIVIAIPLYVTLRQLGIINSLLGLVVGYQVYTLPYCVWMLLGFVRDVPLEMEEAAAIDGASRWRTLWSIVLPLVGPGLAATAILSVIMCWNEFTYALLFLRSPAVFTLPIHIASYITEYEVLWGELMGIGLLASLPILLLSGYVQKYLLRGFAMGFK
ncbi:MAG: carbohydrate ABC transporter permease [Candidatus Acetothermia bacterium]|jgi:multiple sugar transport system permease protein|nr:carbohydrate ABC transporter permease [Candidatus Acetothermia bacterium]